VVRHITINLKDSVSLIIRDFRSAVVGTWLAQIRTKQTTDAKWAGIESAWIVENLNGQNSKQVVVLTKQSGEEKQSRLVRQSSLMIC